MKIWRLEIYDGKIGTLNFWYLSEIDVKKAHRACVRNGYPNANFQKITVPTDRVGLVGFLNDFALIQDENFDVVYPEKMPTYGMSAKEAKNLPSCNKESADYSS